MRWNPRPELGPRERLVAKHIARMGKFYLFLRDVHSELFDEAFQARLESAYGKARGTEAIPPSYLATVLLLQAYDQVGDAAAVETVLVDMRWQLVLDCVGVDKAPFSQGVLVKFRERLIEHDLDRALLERTVQVAKQTGRFGWQKLKAALDSSPLIGAGRVEDTWNLLGRALATVVRCAAKVGGVSVETVLEEAGLRLLGGSSLKATLDIDWDDGEAQAEALNRLLAEVERVEDWVATHVHDTNEEPALREALEALHRLLAQDLEPDPSGKGGRRRIREGTARDRMASLGDPEMRHGRKSRSKKFIGYKRHVVKAVGSAFVLGALALPANQPEHEAAEPLLADARKAGHIGEVLIDRGYLASSAVVALHNSGVPVLCKPWPSRNRGLYTKEDFDIQPASGRITCPAGVTARFEPPGVVHFPVRSCEVCTQRHLCTRGTHGQGRSVSIHPQEAMLVELRARRRTPEGRQALRERTSVEHTLARIQAIQGPKARYKGIRKNTLDLRRCAAVANIQALRVLKDQAAAA